MQLTGLLNKPISVLKFVLANVILSIFLLFAFMNGGNLNTETLLIGFLWTFSISFTQWAGINLLHGIIHRKISWIETPVKRTFIQIIVFLTYSICAYILVQFFNFYLWRGFSPSQSWSWIIKSLPFTLLTSSIISLIFTAIGFFNAWKQSLIQSEKLKAEMMAYKYESLRNQINPHFLFNSLNVLSDLVYDDQAMAVKFIQQLSDLFRYVLDSRDKELVPLNDELEFIHSYTFLLKTRYEEKLNIEINVQPKADDYIVPMTLQLLIENAVKHNEVSAAFPLRIIVSRKEGLLEVENSLKPKNIGDELKKTGLKNISQQFAFFSEQPIKIITTDERFVVRVPILKSLER